MGAIGEDEMIPDFFAEDAPTEVEAPEAAAEEAETENPA